VGAGKVKREKEKRRGSHPKKEKARVKYSGSRDMAAGGLATSMTIAMPCWCEQASYQVIPDVTPQ
jgi:hypothetical protein